MPRKQLKPPIKLRRKFAPLIALCRERIITSPPQTSGTGCGDALITVVCRWPTKPGLVRMLPDLPKDFPTGVILERDDTTVVIRHNCVALLSYFKARNYCNFDSKDLFRMRLPIMMVLAKLELKLDRMLEGINVDVEQQAQELLDE